MTDNEKIQRFGEAFRKCVDKSGEKFRTPVGPTGKTIALCLSTATDDQLTRAMAAIQKEVIARSIVTSHVRMPPRQGMTYHMLEQEIATLLEEKGEELAAHLDRREAEKMQPLSDEAWLDMLEGKLQIEPVESIDKVLPYLQEGINIPSCPVISKEQLKGDPLDFDGMEI